MPPDRKSRSFRAGKTLISGRGKEGGGKGHGQNYAFGGMFLTSAIGQEVNNAFGNLARSLLIKTPPDGTHADSLSAWPLGASSGGRYCLHKRRTCETKGAE